MRRKGFNETPRNPFETQVRDAMHKLTYAANLPRSIRQIRTKRQVELILTHETNPQEWGGPTGGLGTQHFTWEKIRADFLAFIQQETSDV
jgi:hypothetical protein